MLTSHGSALRFSKETYMKRKTALRAHMASVLFVALCIGFGLNLGLPTEVPEPIPNQYETRHAIVAECYPDESNTGFQYVFVLVSGGDYDGQLYEMRRPIRERFHAEQGLEIVFDTAETSDPTDDEPVNIIKPNFV